MSVTARTRAQKLIAGAVGLLQLLVYLPLTVTWYRMVVIGDDAARQRPTFLFGARERRVLLWQIIAILACVVIGFIGIAAALAIAFRSAGHAVIGVSLAVVLGVLTLLVLFVALNRFNFVMVLAAMDQPVSLKIAWRMTEGMSGRLLLAMIAIILAGIVLDVAWRLAALLVGLIVAMAANTTVGAIVPYLLVIGHSLSGLLTLVASATLFGLIYRMLMTTRAEAVPPVSDNPI